MTGSRASVPSVTAAQAVALVAALSALAALLPTLGRGFRAELIIPFVLAVAIVLLASRRNETPRETPLPWTRVLALLAVVTLVTLLLRTPSIASPTPAAIGRILVGRFAPLLVLAGFLALAAAVAPAGGRKAPAPGIVLGFASAALLLFAWRVNGTGPVGPAAAILVLFVLALRPVDR